MTYLHLHFSELEPDQLARLLAYQSLIMQWNDKVNLVSRKDIGNFLQRHVAPSLSINRIFSFPANARVIDIGTGGGLPGVPLAITNPKVNFCLVDSIGKKVTAVRDIVNQLGLENVDVQNIRAEQIDEKFDFVVARAVTNLPNFLREVQKLRNRGTRIFYLKGGDCTEELRGVSDHKIYNIGEILDDFELRDKMILEIF